MFYDYKIILKCILGFIAMMIAMKFTNGTGFVAIFGLIIVGAMKRDGVLLLYGLAMSMVTIVGNSNLMPKGQVYAIAQRASMLLLAILLVAQVFGQRQNRSLTCFLSLLLYIVYMLVISFIGWCPMISLMKLLLFTSVYVAYFGVANTVATSSKDLTIKVRSVFLSVAIFFIVGSIMLIPFPGISQLSGEAYLEALKSGADLTSLFTGMTSHSQALGPMIASIGVFLVSDLLFGIKRGDRLYICLLICVPILLWKTSSRTAMGTFIVSAMIVIQMFISTHEIKSRWKGKVISIVLLLFSAFSFFVLILPSAREKALGFIIKYRGREVSANQVNIEEVLITRRGKWEEGIDNWKKSPLVGNGFQVSEDMVGINVGLTTLSAPIEKSVWISAILEEGGVFGLGIFLFFLMFCIVRLKRTKAYVGLSCLISFIMINFGEFTMFSMSGIGGFLWALLFIGVSLDIRRNKYSLNRRNGYVVYGHSPISYNLCR